MLHCSLFCNEETEDRKGLGETASLNTGNKRAKPSFKAPERPLRIPDHLFPVCRGKNGKEIVEGEKMNKR